MRVQFPPAITFGDFLPPKSYSWRSLQYLPNTSQTTIACDNYYKAVNCESRNYRWAHETYCIDWHAMLAAGFFVACNPRNQWFQIRCSYFRFPYAPVSACSDHPASVWNITRHTGQTEKFCPEYAERCQQWILLRLRIHNFMALHNDSNFYF